MFIENTTSSNIKKEDGYDILFESNPHPMWIYEVETLKFAAVNKSALEIYGYTKEEFKNLTLKDIRPEEEVDKLLENVSREGSSYQRSTGWRHKKKDGSIIDVEIISRDLLFNGVKCRLVAVNDITDKKRSDENFKLVIESSPNAMVLVNKRGIITLVNRQTEILFGYEREDLIGKPLDILIPPRFKNSHKKDEMAFFKSPGARNMTHRAELYGLHKDGREIPLEIGLNPINMDGSTSVIASINDITEKKKIHDELKSAENRYRTTLESMLVGFQIIGYDWKYLYVNKSAAEHGKKTKEELIGKTMMDVYPGIENTEMFSTLNNCMVLKIPYRMENEFVYENGEKNWFQLTIEPVPEGALILSRDITQEKKTEEELKTYRDKLEQLILERTAQLEAKTKELNVTLELQKEREENLQLIFASINDYAIILIDVNGFITSWNSGAEKLIQYKPDEVLGKHYSLLFPEEEIRSELPKKELDRAMSHTRTEAEGWRLKKDGSRFWTFSTINVLKDKRGNTTGFIKILKDMTERMIAAEKLKEHTLKLEELNKELESFSYSVSHDLRAPLRHIAGFIQLLEKDIGESLSEKNKKYFNYVSGAVKKMGLLIDDLLSFSRMGRAEIHKSDVAIRELIDDCITDLNVDLQGRNIKWKIAEMPVVSADKNLLKQVFLNLISNSIKYTRKKEEAVIEIGVNTVKKDYVFLVKDNGAGFDMKYADKLFGVFQRLHSESEYEGTGIGLANVKRIISRHGGQVWAEGEVNNGASFYFSLKRK